MQSKMTRQVELSRNRLSQELDRLKKTERSVLRMLESDRRLFRMKHKNHDITMDTRAMDLMHMSNTHNPDFSYENDGAATSRACLERKIREKDFYESVRAMLFTDDEIDVDKIFCLHLLTAHAVGLDGNELDPDGSISLAAIKKELRFTDEEGENCSDNAWNDILPCYIVEIQRDEPKFHKSRRRERLMQQQQQQQQQQDAAIPRQSAEANEELDRAQQQTQILQQLASALGKIPNEASHPSSSRSSSLLEFNSECDEKTVNEPAEINKSYNKSVMNDKFLDDVTKRAQKVLTSDFTSIISSIQQQPVGTFNSTLNSNSNEITKIKRKNYFYLHPSYASTSELKKNFKTISICINSQVKQLIRVVLQVLQACNTKKMKILFKSLKDPKLINLKLTDPKIQLFLQSVRDSSLIASPENFIHISTLAVDVSDVNIKSKFRKYVVAKTLEVAPIPGLDNLLTSIRYNIMSQAKQAKDNKANINSLEKKESVLSASSESCNWKSIKTRNNTSLTAVNKPHVLNHQLESAKSKEINNLILDDRYAGSSKKKEDQQTYFNVNKSTDVNTTFPSLNDSKLISGLTQPRKSSKDIFYMDPDRIILRRLSHPQRILVGQMCASLKTKKVNNEGLLKEKIPLLSLITPVLSRESIRDLTQGTIYERNDAQTVESEILRSEYFDMTEKLTSAMILKIRHEAAEIETGRHLEVFMKKST